MLRILMMIHGVLSLAGLIGVPLVNMQIQNIRVLCYAVLAPIVFLLRGVVFVRIQPAPANAEKCSTTANINR
jgi:hypothetical protein